MCFKVSTPSTTVTSTEAAPTYVSTGSNQLQADQAAARKNRLRSAMGFSKNILADNSANKKTLLGE